MLSHAASSSLRTRHVVNELAFALARQAPALAGKLGGGAERDRTDDLRLAKPALSQLSYSPDGAALAAAADMLAIGAGAPIANVTWARAELNCRPHAYQACALTT